MVDLGDLGVAASFAVTALNRHWAEIAARVPAELLPREKPAGRRRLKAFEEYGCGHYGCVFPTGKPGVVLKVTTDPTEARFVQMALEIGEWPDGIVRYYDIMQLAATYRKRPIMLIWREEAFNVGTWPPPFGRRLDYDEQARFQFRERLYQFKNHAAVVGMTLYRARDRAPAMLAEARALKDWAWDFVSLDDAEAERGSAQLRRLTGARAIAARVRACEIVAELMSNEPQGYVVGQAMSFYLEHNILLADVHADNVGEVEREEYGGMVLVITDPGHAIVL